MSAKLIKTLLSAYFITAVLVIFIGIAESNKIHGNKSHHHVVQFKKNVRQTVELMKCEKPQKRLVYIEDEYDKYQPKAMYFPRAAMVHRCDKTTGCCVKLTEICSPAETRNVTFVFQEVNIGSTRKSNIKVNLIDHVRCECQTRDWDPPR